MRRSAPDAVDDHADVSPPLKGQTTAPLSDARFPTDQDAMDFIVSEITRGVTCAVTYTAARWVLGGQRVDGGIDRILGAVFRTGNK